MSKTVGALIIAVGLVAAYAIINQEPADNKTTKSSSRPSNLLTEVQSLASSFSPTDQKKVEEFQVANVIDPPKNRVDLDPNNDRNRAREPASRARYVNHSLPQQRRDVDLSVYDAWAIQKQNEQRASVE